MKSIKKGNLLIVALFVAAGYGFWLLNNLAYEVN